MACTHKVHKECIDTYAQVKGLPLSILPCPECKETEESLSTAAAALLSQNQSGGVAANVIDVDNDLPENNEVEIGASGEFTEELMIQTHMSINPARYVHIRVHMHVFI